MPKPGFRTISWSSGSPVFYFPCSKSDLLFWNGYYAAISKIIRGGRIRTWKSIKTWASRIVLLYVNIQISPSPPYKKRLLSTTAKGVFLRPFGVFCDFSRFFGVFKVKNGLRSSIGAVPEPVFFIFRVKNLVYFLRFFALQRKRKSVEAERLEP